MALTLRPFTGSAARFGDMEIYQLGDLSITLNKKGSDTYTKASYPIRYGHFSEIKTPDHIFQFNLNGEIKFIQGVGKTGQTPWNG